MAIASANPNSKPTGLGLGDYIAPLDTAKFLSKHPNAKTYRNHFAQIGTSYDAQRAGYRELDADLLSSIHVRQSTKTAAEREERMLGHKPKQSIELAKEIGGLNEQREQNQNELAKIPRNRVTDIDAGLTTARPDEWTDLKREEFDNGKSSNECRQALQVTIKVEREIQSAFITEAEGEDIIRRQYAQWKKAGAIDWLPTLLGGSYTPNGDFRPNNPSARIIPPIKWIHAEAGRELVTMALDDIWAMIVNADSEDRLLNAHLHQMRQFLADKRKIRLSEKPELLRVQRQNILHARRVLEAACFREELEGKRVKRPDETPWYVLIWCERATKPKLVEKPAADIDENIFEGEGA